MLVSGIRNDLEAATIAHTPRSILGLNRAVVNAPNKLSPLNATITGI